MVSRFATQTLHLDHGKYHSHGKRFEWSESGLDYLIAKVSLARTTSNSGRFKQDMAGSHVAGPSSSSHNDQASILRMYRVVGYPTLKWLPAWCSSHSARAQGESSIGSSPPNYILLFSRSMCCRGRVWGDPDPAKLDTTYIRALSTMWAWRQLIVPVHHTPILLVAPSSLNKSRATGHLRRVQKQQRLSEHRRARLRLTVCDVTTMRSFRRPKGNPHQGRLYCAPSLANETRLVRRTEACSRLCCLLFYARTSRSCGRGESRCQWSIAFPTREAESN